MKAIILFLSISLISISISAQSVGIGTTTPSASAQLDISSNSKGLLIPRLTLIERNNITDPADGLLVYVTTDSMFYVYAGSAWLTLNSRTRELIDEDNDTKILVEQNPDEDIIRFRLAGQERWVMEGARLEPVNTGKSIFIGQGAGANDDLTDNNNIANGYEALYSNTTGAFNSAIGFRALYSNISGFSNVANGYEALYSNTTGSDNTAIGFRALYNNTTGQNNTAIGFRALLNNTTGEYNTAIGYYALNSNTIASYNIAMGYKALSSNTTGTGNTAIGTYALTDNTTGEYNTAYGNSALFSNTTGIYNTANGNSALFSNTTGIYNTANGVNVLKNNTSGEYNTASGYGALYYNTIGNHNEAYGSLALYLNTTGSFNTAYGGSALLGNTTGNDNVAIGHNALSSNTANANTASGSHALRSNNTGENNVANGSHALFSNITGENNTANGSSALYSNIANANTANGFQALVLNTTGAANTASGVQSLSLNSSGSYNTANGFNTLSANITGTKNTAIGYNANVGSFNLDNATAIGANAIVSQSNSLVLGNNANVGIGTSSPSSKLHVIGTVNATAFSGDGSSITGISGDNIGNHTANQELNLNGNWLSGDGDAEGLFIDNTGNLGIGTASPGVKIHIEGGSDAALASGGFLQLGSTGGSNMVMDQNEIMARANGTSNTLYLNHDGGDVAINGLGIDNVGIGTSSPSTSAQLEISSNSKGLLIPRMTESDRDNILSPADGLLVYVTDDKMFYVFAGSSWLALNERVWALMDADNDTKVLVEQNPDEDIIRFQLAGQEKWIMQGNRIEPVSTGGSVFIGEGAGMNDDLSDNRNVAVGFGTLLSNTTGSLNTANGYQALYSNSTAIQNTALGFQTLYSNTTGFRNTANGYRALFSNIDGNWNTAYGFEALQSNTGGDLNNAVGYQALYNNTTGSWNTATGREALYNNTTGSSNTSIGYKSGVGSGALINATAIGANAVVNQSNSLVLGNNVNVGIGTSTPSERLHVVGNICYTGSSAACSDIRYKIGFESFSKTIEKLKRVKGQYYYWNRAAFPNKDFTGERQIGVMAQELEAVFPEIVLTDKDGYKSVDYSRLTPILLEAIKEQQDMIESLESENNEMRAEVSDIKGQNKNMQNDINLIKAAINLDPN